MPNIVVKVPAGLLSAEAKAAVLKNVNAAAAEAERIPADPRNQVLTWVVIEEVAPGNWVCGGQDMTQAIVPVIVNANIPAGVLDAAGRARYVQLLQKAVVDALPGEKRRIATSCVLTDVADGTWGASGEIWRLPQIAAAAGFEHLQHLAGKP